MKIIFRIIHHPIDTRGVYAGIINYAPAVEADGVSATANSDAFSPVMRICSELKYDRLMVKRASKRVNRTKKIATLNCLNPKLFLVPKTNGVSAVEELSKELLDAVSYAQIQNLNFTHYGFVKEKLPAREIIQVLSVIKQWRDPSRLKTVIWDIDRRYIEEMKRLENFVI